MTRVGRARGLGFVALVLATACGPCAGEDPAQGTETQAQRTGDEASKAGATDDSRAALAAVEGVVRLAGGAEVPAFQPAAIGREPDRPAAPEGCPPPKKRDRRPLALAEDRGLSNVLVTTTQFDEAPPHEPTTHTVSIRDCRLTPRVVAATRGDALTVENETDHAFMPTLGKTRFTQTLLKGQELTTALDRGVGASPLTCGFASPCGRTDVIVQHHPVYAVTDDQGRFRIDNVPPGEGLVVHAWHPLLRRTKKTFSIAANETVELELEVSPASRGADAGTSEAAAAKEVNPDGGEGAPANP